MCFPINISFPYIFRMALVWLRNFCNACGDEPDLLMYQIITLFKKDSLMDESFLIDLVGYDQMHAIPTLVSMRKSIIEEWNLALAKGGPGDATFGEAMSQIKIKKKTTKKNLNEIDLVTLLGRSNDTTLNIASSTGGMAGQKLTLPEGTSRHLLEGYEEFRIPSSAPPAQETDLIPITRLPLKLQSVFSKDSNFFNRIQSQVYDTAFHSSDNFLMCAPTGAGKTNVALLSICRLINEGDPTFKAVYMAPMKALVSEVVEKFKQKLSHLNVNVREFTGDISIPRSELAACNVIVTVPEKWDILMRNMLEGSLLSEIRLMIIDEIHLLNDERGAVIESIVARTMQHAERTVQPIRFVALSATFPNYEDIAQFLSVSKRNTFFFGPEFRPVPLEQTITGVGKPTTAAITRPTSSDQLNKILCEKVIQILLEGQQVMVFVHARNDTVKTAEALIDLISAKMGDLLAPELGSVTQTQLVDQLKKINSRTRQSMHHLIQSGITIHHAGMLRPERTLAEKLFKEGVARILVCTSTLSWGVNLPSRYVIIKGTNIWDSATGGFRDLGLLDILQIFGRAGRPQFDTIGKATLLTSRDKLDYFVRLITSQIPIESRFLTHLPDALNAEIVMGNISSVNEAVDWLRYTYLYVRFFKAPQKYGIAPYEISQDPYLLAFREKQILSAAETLNGAKMIRINGVRFASTEIGRVAAHFYIRYETAELFATKLRADMSDPEIIELVAGAHEFQQLKCREEEMDELERVSVDKEICPINKIRGGGVSSIAGKVSVLLQVYVSRNYYFSSSSLGSDSNYISQNINRLFRALFRISLTVGVSGLAQRLLEWCKCVERRLWPHLHFFSHYTQAPSWGPPPSNHLKLMKEWIPQKLGSNMNLDKIWQLDLSRKELSALVSNQPDALQQLEHFLAIIPYISISYRVFPISQNLMRLELTLDCQLSGWSDVWNGTNEPFHLFVSDTVNDDVYHHEEFSVLKKSRTTPIVITTIIPLVEDPRPNQLVVSIVSDRYVGLQFFESVTIPEMPLSSVTTPTTDLLDLAPLPTRALNNASFESIYTFSHFNPIQTQMFHTLYHSNANILCGAPTGSGKTLIAELAILRLFNKNLGGKIIYIAPMKALSRERISDWGKRLGGVLKKSVVELTGDFSPDILALERADVIVTTPEKWDGISRNWKTRKYVRDTKLVIIDEVHLLGQERGAVLEMIVSRMKLIGMNSKIDCRFIALSTALANSSEIADWLDVSVSGMYNFKPSVRPVPMTCHIQGFSEKHYCPRMATMNKPCLLAISQYSAEKPVIIFVSSRRQTRLTGFDLVTFATQDCEIGRLFSGPGHSPWLNGYVDVSTVENDALKHCLAFGVGLHHAGLTQSDRDIVEHLFATNVIQVLIATSTMAVGINLPAHLVIIKGTEYFDPKTRKYVDMPVTDVLQMMGRAGRPQFDTSAVSVVFVAESKKNFYRKFLYSSFPLESSLHLQLTDHLNAEIASGSIVSKQQAIEFIKWTYLGRRLQSNPDFYRSDPTQSVDAYIQELIDVSLASLEKSFCVNIVRDTVSPTKIGQIASLYYLKHETVFHFVTKLNEGPFSILALAKILCDCPEYATFPMRHRDDEYNEQLAAQFPIKFSGPFDSPHAKTFLLCLLHWFPQVVPPVADYFTDLKSFLDQSVRLIQGMLEVLLLTNSNSLKSVLNLLLLNQSLASGCSPWKNPAEHFTGRKSDLALPQLLGTKGVPKLPLTTLQLSGKNGVEISVIQMSDIGEFAVGKQDTKRRRVGWWIVAANESTGQVFRAKRFTLNKCKRFQIPEHHATVFLMSDCYVGLDQQMSI